MKKTFRKAIAVLLAVLMVAFSVPFTALAEVDSVGWWGDNNWDSAKNPELLAMLQEREDGTYAFDDYEGWNSATWDYGFALGDALSPETDLGQGADALAMVKEQYKPTLTISVWDQGTADNRIFRKFYGYGTGAANAITYDKAVADGYKLNPADLKAGQRIMVTFEIGGLDMIYAGQIKGIADPEYLAGAYYKLNPTTKDQWAISTTDAMDLKVGQQRGYNYYGTALSDGTGPDYKRASGQILIPYSGNAAPPASSYVGVDQRGFGEHGLYIGAFSFEVLQDCNLADVLHMNQDADKNEARGVTVFTPYAPEEVGERAKYTFQTDAESVHETAGLIALNWDGYKAGSTECTHANAVKTEAKAATCTEAGNAEYWTCPDCNKMFSDAACTTEITEVPTIAAKGHTITKVEANDATCTEDGNSEYYVCSVCDKMFSDAEGTNEISEIPVISATGHSLAKTDEVPATCTSKGTEAYWTCTACGKMFSDAEGKNEISAPVEIPTIDHNYTMVKTEATCTEPSSEVYTCPDCGDTYTTHVDPAKGHTAVKTDEVPATCTTEGTEAYWTCSACGKMFSDEACTAEITAPVTIPAKGHTAVKTDEVPATCTTEGTEAYWTCSACGKMFSDEACTTEITAPATIDKLGHDFSVVVSSTAGDCQTEGTTVYKCSRCEETKEVAGAYGPHTAVKTEAKDATCTEDGYEAYWTCSVCNKMFSDENCANEIAAPVVINAKGHTPVKTEAKAATCTEDGYEAYWTCSVCDKMFSDENCANEIAAPVVINAKGHTPGEPQVVTVPATIDADGSVTTTVYCSVCNEKLSEDVQVLPMLPSVVITVDATDLGTTSINGTDSTNGYELKVAKDSAVTLTAVPAAGAAFVGWSLNGKIVSDDATFTTTAFVDATYTPVFTETAADTFTVVFVDNYGNVISTQEVANASEITAPTAPTRPGYTFTGWSVDYTTLTEGATIYAQFEKNAAAAYTVTANGCTITTADGATATDKMENVAYDTLVTITNNGTAAASWKIGESTVAFGESYTFYVGSDVTVVPQFDETVTAKPTVSAVSVSEVTEANGLKRAVFLATRSMTDDCKLISAGYIYGKAADVTADTTIDNVNGTTVKRIDAKSSVEQFSVAYGLRAQTGSIAAKAYVAYVDADGATQVIYADLQTYTYA